MPPYAKTRKLTLYCGDVREALDEIKPGSINTCITSPPYFALRNYGHPDQLGLEATPNQYVRNLVQVCRSIRKTLADDGTFWLNIGDSYCRNPAKGQHKPGAPGKQKYLYERGGGRASATFDLKLSGLKEKDLIGIPWRTALALQQPWLTCEYCGAEHHKMEWAYFPDGDQMCPGCHQIGRGKISEPGWYLRGDVIWHKPNALPNSVKDRPVTDHEYVFLFAKSKKYHFDHDAIKEQTKNGKKRSKRTVWSVNTRTFKGAHFAVFPPDLIEPMIEAGAPAGGVVLDPFFGSGTTALVALGLGRRAVGVELNSDYCDLALERLGIKKARSKR